MKKEKSIWLKIWGLYVIVFNLMRTQLACWIMPKDAFFYMADSFDSYLESIEEKLDDL